MGNPQTIAKVDNKILEDDKKKFVANLNQAMGVLKRVGIRVDHLYDNMNRILEEKTTFLDQQGNEHIMVGKTNNAEKGTYGYGEIFINPEFRLHPFKEVSRNMHSHFKMYCLVNGITEKDILSLTEENPSKEAEKRIKDLKKPFFEMVYNKDMNAIADFYVKLAQYAEKKIPGLIRCGDLSELENNEETLVLLQDAASYLNQTLNLDETGNGISEDQRNLIDDVNRRLKEIGKDYTLSDIFDMLCPTAMISNTMVGYRDHMLHTDLKYEDLNIEKNPNEVENQEVQSKDKTFETAYKLLTLPKIIEEQKNAAIAQGKDPQNFVVKIGADVKLTGDVEYNEKPFNQLLTENIQLLHNRPADPFALSEKLHNNVIQGFFSAKANPKEYNDLLTAMRAAGDAERKLEEVRKTGKPVSMTLMASLDDAYRNVMKTSEAYLRKFEPGSGDSAERYKLVVQARNMGREKSRMLGENPQYHTFNGYRKNGADLLDETVAVTKLRRNVMDALDEILKEPYTYTGSGRFTLTIEGMNKNPEKRTYGIMDVFAQPEYMGKPFFEASRDMSEHFKMYCLTKGMKETELLEIAQKGHISKARKQQFREWKKEFLDMIIRKDLDKISDMYVEIGRQVEADRDRFAHLQPGVGSAIREDRSLFLKYAGSTSWYEQSIDHHSSKVLVEGKQLVALVNQKLKASGKDFTFDNLSLPLFTINSMVQSTILNEKGKDSMELLMESTGDQPYTAMHANAAVLQDYMHTPEANRNDRSWLSAMPDRFEEFWAGIETYYGKTMEERLANQAYYANLPKVAEIPQPLASEEKQAKDEVRMKRQKELRNGDLGDGKKNNDKINSSQEENQAIYEQYPALQEIEGIMGSQSLYLDIYKSSDVPYPAENVLKNLHDEDLTKLHDKAKKYFQHDAEVKERLFKEYKFTDTRFRRLGYCFLDPAETDEAKEKNKKFLEEVNTPEGATAFANKVVKQLLEMDIRDLYPANAVTMAEAYLEKPSKYELLYAAADLVNLNAGAFSEIEEPMRSALKEKSPMLQFGQNFKDAAKLMSKEGWPVYLQSDLTRENADKISETVLKRIPKLTEKKSPFLDELSDLPALFSSLSAAMEEQDIIDKMEESGLMKDNQILKRDEKILTRRAALDQLKKGTLKIDDIEINQPTSEQKKAYEKTLAELPVTIEDVKALNEYKPMHDYHSQILESRGVSVPTLYEIKEAMQDPEGQKLHEEAKVFYKKRVEDLDKLTSQFPRDENMHWSLRRIYSLMLDNSGTIEAAEKNKAYLESMKTREGQIKLVNYVVHKLMSLPDDMFLAKDVQEAARKYMEHPEIYDLGFAAIDLLSYENQEPRVLQLPETLHDAFKKKRLFLQQGGSFKEACEIMARDDWGLISHLEIKNRNALGFPSSYVKKDTYNIFKGESVEERKPKEATISELVLDFGISMKGIFRMAGMPAEQKRGLFSYGSEITLKGEKKEFNNELIEYIEEHGAEEISVKADEAKIKEVNEQLDALDTKFREAANQQDNVRREDKSIGTSGNALRKEMQAIYNRLEGANHGAFFSSKEYDAVLTAVYELAHNRYTPTEVEERLHKIGNEKNGLAAIYLNDKTGNLKQRTKDRVDAVSTAKTGCNDILKALERQHKTAAAMHEALHGVYSPENVSVKTSEELYKEETARMTDARARKARDLTVKFHASEDRLNDMKAKGVTYVQPLEEVNILKRLHDDKVVTLHDNAVKAAALNQRYTKGGDEELKFGNADSQMNRLARLFLDVSGTPQAKEHNRLLRAAMTTKEGCQKLFSHMVHRLMTSKTIDKLMSASNMEEFVSAYMEDPQVCEFSFLTEELGKFAEGLEEPLKTAYKDRVSAVQVGSVAVTSITYAASDAYLAYPDMKIGPENADKWLNIGKMLSILTPDEKNLENLAKYVNFFGTDLSYAEVFKKMQKQDLLGGKARFKDENGTYLNLDKAAKKLAANEKVTVVPLNEEAQEKLQAQLDKLDVSDPLDIGRKVLEGKQQGMNGGAVPESYQKLISNMQKSLEKLAGKYPDQKSEQMEKAFELLKKAAEKHPADNAEVQKCYQNLTETLHETYKNVPQETPLEQELCNELSQLAVKAERSYNLAHQAAEHQAYKEMMAKEHDNGIAEFTAAYLSPESAGPKALKDMAKAGLEVMENCEGMDFEKLSEEKKQDMYKGVSAMLLLNQMKYEGESKQKRNPDSVTALLSKNPETVEDVCSYMAQSRENAISRYCEDMFSSRDHMKAVLSDEPGMRKTFEGFIADNSIKRIVQASLDKTMDDLLAEERKSQEQREDDDAFGKFYSKPAHDEYVKQQKQLGRLLLDHAARKGEPEGQDAIGNLKGCFAYMIAAKEIEEFVKENHEYLGKENCAALCSQASIRERASRIYSSEGLTALISKASPFMKKKELCTLAIGADKVLNPAIKDKDVNTEPTLESETKVKELLKKYTERENKIDPISMFNYHKTMKAKVL